MGGGGGQSTSTITEIALPEYADPYAKVYLDRAWVLTRDKQVLSYEYTGTTFATWNTDEQDGIQKLADRANNGSQTIDKATTLLTSIIKGETIGINPNLDSLFNAQAALIKSEFLEDVLPAVDNAANNIGMYGSSGHAIMRAKMAEKVKDKLNRASLNIYYQDYEVERRRCFAQYAQLITLGHEDLRNAELLRQAGLYKREYAQGQLNDAYKLWLAKNEGDIKKLEVYANALRCLRGAYISKTEPYYRPSTWSQIAGLAMAGGGMAASYFGQQRANTKAIQSSDGLTTQIDERPENTGISSLGG